MKVDLNCDLGESFGAYKIGLDSEVIPYISSANVACGFHASDPTVMSKTVKMCAEYKVAVGAHPGFYDLMGFGRRNMNVSYDEAKAYVMYQTGALDAFCKANGTEIQHIKPHGALYNMAGKDYNLAKAICEGIAEINKDYILLGLSGSNLIKAACDTGLRTANEVFADRGYTDDGSLVPRNQPGALIEDEDVMIKRVISMVKDGTVETVSGKLIEIKADSICVHGDGAKAVEFVKRIRNELTAAGIEIAPIKEII